MEAIPKSDTKSVISFDISIKPTTWIGQKSHHSQQACPPTSPLKIDIIYLSKWEEYASQSADFILFVTLLYSL